MNDHPDWCPKRDHPLALALWRSGRPSRLDILCAKRKHRLAAVVYDMANEGGLVLCQPGFSGLMDHYELGDVAHGFEGKMHMHAALRLLSELKTAGEVNQVGRCHCGSWTYSPAQIEQGLSQPHSADARGTAFIYANYTMTPRGRHAG